MRIIRDERDFIGLRSVVALGMFDGVHIGHQKLIREAVKLAGEMGAESVVCTFDRHPLSVIRPEAAPEALLPLEKNLEKFEALGAQWALVKGFTREFSAAEPEDFLRDLVSKMRVCTIVAGENYTFGRKGRGNADMLRDAQNALGFKAVIVPPVMDGEVMASSTYIRSLLKSGDTAHAERLLAIAGKE
ncbi:MAG: FAD synthetase family protein [Clostridia bacterium]|nr:FAD synthetase family protein [Clostridia bacterium]